MDWDLWFKKWLWSYLGNVWKQNLMLWRFTCVLVDSRISLLPWEGRSHIPRNLIWSMVKIFNHYEYKKLSNPTWMTVQMNRNQVWVYTPFVQNVAKRTGKRKWEWFICFKEQFGHECSMLQVWTISLFLFRPELYSPYQIISAHCT